jgi:hypothetical protein
MSPEMRELSLKAERGDYRAIRRIKEMIDNNSPEGNQNCSQEQK